MDKNERMFKIAFKLYRKKKFERSLHLLNELIKNEQNGKNLSNALFLKGDICHDLHDFCGAIKTYSEIILNDKNDDTAFNNRALAYWGLEEYRKALNDYLNAVKLNDSNETAHRGVGEMFLKLDRPKIAIPYFKRAIKLKPEYGEAIVSLGKTYIQLGDRKSAFKSLSLIEKLIQEGKDSGRMPPNILYMKGDLCYDLRDFSSVIDIHSGILSNDKNDDNSYTWRGMAYGELGKYRKALNDYLKAVKLNDLNESAHHGAGEMLLKLDMPKKAIPHLKRSIELYPENRYVFRALGIAYYRTGKWGTAYECFKKVLEFDKNDKFSIKTIKKIDKYYIAYEKKMREKGKKGKKRGGSRRVN